MFIETTAESAADRALSEWYRSQHDSWGFLPDELSVRTVAARSFFAKVLDGLGARLDRATAATFDLELLQAMVVGRPVGDT